MRSLIAAAALTFGAAAANASPAVRTDMPVLTATVSTQCASSPAGRALLNSANSHSERRIRERQLRNC